MPRPTLLVLMLSALAIQPASTPLSFAAPGDAQAPAPAPTLAASTTAFRNRLDEYVKLRKEIARKLPEVKETGDPRKISEREKALGAAIAMARATAKPGDLFGDMAPHLARIVAEDWNSRTEAEKKGLLEEVPPNLALKINQPYPTNIPLVSAPGKLLAALPMLPEELEYRIVDRKLLIRDRDANLILDVLSGAPVGRDR